jgi:phosphate transport system substrate-binding protein
MSTTSCENPPQLTDTVSSGRITVVADECYQPILDSEKMVFEAQYPNAKINLVYKPALDVLQDFENDSVRMIITSMAPDSSKLLKFNEKRGYMPHISVLAKDAVAFVANKSKKTRVSVSELKDILSGKITDWSQLKHGSYSGKIQVVFDNQRSSTVVFLQDSVLKGEALSQNCFAVKSNLDVLEYVKKNPNAIGIVGASWISDFQDSTQQVFNKTVSPLEVSANDASEYAYYPYQAYIATHFYPMRRYMTATLKEGGPALGRGFLNFMGAEVGQRIILKAGIVPAQVLTRVVSTEN